MFKRTLTLAVFALTGLTMTTGALPPAPQRFKTPAREKTSIPALPIPVIDQHSPVVQQIAAARCAVDLVITIANEKKLKDYKLPSDEIQPGVVSMISLVVKLLRNPKILNSPSGYANAQMLFGEDYALLLKNSAPTINQNALIELDKNFPHINRRKIEENLRLLAQTLYGEFQQGYQQTILLDARRAAEDAAADPAGAATIRAVIKAALNPPTAKPLSRQSAIPTNRGNGKHSSLARIKTVRPKGKPIRRHPKWPGGRTATTAFVLLALYTAHGDPSALHNTAPAVQGFELMAEANTPAAAPMIAPVDMHHADITAYPVQEDLGSAGAINSVSGPTSFNSSNTRPHTNAFVRAIKSIAQWTIFHPSRWDLGPAVCIGIIIGLAAALLLRVFYVDASLIGGAALGIACLVGLMLIFGAKPTPYPSYRETQPFSMTRSR